MTTNQAYQVIQPVETNTPASEVAAFFRRVAAKSNQPRLRGMKGTAQFAVQGAGTWYVTVNDGVVMVTVTVAVTDGDDGKDDGKLLDSTFADCVLTCTADDFLRIVHGEGHMNFLTAVLQGRVALSGDLAFAWMLVESFEFAPGDAASLERSTASSDGK